MDNFQPKPRETDFSLSNLAATWKKWRQNMKVYLTGIMRGKIEEEKYSVFLFLNGERGKDIQHNRMELESRCSEEPNSRR